MATTVTRPLSLYCVLQVDVLALGGICRRAPALTTGEPFRRGV
jgi:hypothetical protein